MKFDLFQWGVLPQPINKNKYSYLNNFKILEKLNILDCPELLTGSGSAVNEYNFLSHFMFYLNPEPIDIIEIGTLLGLGTALLASYCRNVFTFDIIYRNSHPVWKVLEVDNKINCFTGDQEFIDNVTIDLQHLKQFQFNFSFIDGEHKYENVKHDFELVKFCGRVLFHDANIPEIRNFIINEIGGKILNEDTSEPTKFGYWENK